MFSDSNFEYELLSNSEVKLKTNLLEHASDIDIISPFTYNNNDYRIVEIYPDVFKESSNLRILKLSSTIKVLGSSCFCASRKLVKVVIPVDSELEVIGDFCFDKCTSLVDFEITPNVQYIGLYCFCGSLKTCLFIPKSVTDIKYGAFSFCSNLKTIEVDEENHYYTEYNGSIYTKNLKNFVVACSSPEIWIRDSVENILPGALSNNIIQIIKLPYLLDSFGWFQTVGEEPLTLLYCGLKKFDKLNADLGNRKYYLITTNYALHKDNFGVKASEYLNFCEIDILINPHITRRIKSAHKTKFLLPFLWSNSSVKEIELF